MDRHIELTEVKNTYITIEEAKQMNGLRLVLGEYPIPGPWRESCKSIFFVKNIPYKSVRTSNEGCSDLMIGANNSQSELIELTGQSSAPVAMWNNERPRSTWVEKLNLAERLEPNPPLIPRDINERALMFGLINELQIYSNISFFASVWPYIFESIISLAFLSTDLILISVGF